MRYELYYQPSIQGRGEFVRLSLEDAGADYLDVARDPNFGRPGIVKFLEDPSLEHPPFAPPFLKAGKLLISQTANILQFLAPRLSLVPKNEASRLWAHQLQLTIADFHPVFSGGMQPNLLTWCPPVESYCQLHIAICQCNLTHHWPYDKFTCLLGQ